MGKKFEDIKKVKAVERMMLENTGGDNYTTFYCEEHGFQQKRNDISKDTCGFSMCTSVFREVTKEEVRTLLDK